MTFVVPPALIPTVLGKSAPLPPLQAQVVAAAIAQASQQQARSTAARTETRTAVPRSGATERTRTDEEKRLPDAPVRRGGLLDVSV